MTVLIDQQAGFASPALTPNVLAQGARAPFKGVALIVKGAFIKMPGSTGFGRRTRGGRLEVQPLPQKISPPVQSEVRTFAAHKNITGGSACGSQ